MNSKDIAIKIENISKCYRIGMKENIHDSLISAMFAFIKTPLKKYHTYRSLYKFDNINPGSIDDSNPDPSDFIWALRDISFQVKQGEVIGVIGRNGAGKSTLLKILSRITDPTYGQIEMHGRISSLLEVGTGFHSELTGRENVYLNGIILGMKKKEMDLKFDEIVDFSGIEKFIDTPVKRYSTGMKVRLAFSVAAHLEPEILLVDEVLAVGDAAFQKKCLNKLNEVGKKGRTVLFVSHNMSAIAQLCERAILLDEGRLVMDGLPQQVVSFYMNGGLGTPAVREWPDIAKAPGGQVACLCAVRVRDMEGRITDIVDISKPIGIEMEYEVLKPGYVLMPNYIFYNEEGVCIFPALDTDPAWRNRPRLSGHYISVAWIPGNLLSEGMYFVDSNLTTLKPIITQFTERQVVSFRVVDNYSGYSARGDWPGPVGGVVRPLLKWSTQFSPNGHSAAEEV